MSFFFFFFNDTATTEIYTLSLHDALPTSSPTDLAINGQGFFCVNTAADATGQALFTRAGSFTPDANGDLKNTAGLYLMGYPISSDGTVGSQLGNISTNGLGGKG